MITDKTLSKTLPVGETGHRAGHGGAVLPMGGPPPVHSQRRWGVARLGVSGAVRKQARLTEECTQDSRQPTV